ncbi:MAG: hypothetical protein NUV51_09365 [Sulfuricaulis sp.]|nr:hypothetical protein [Sulfuricaulis sp.]
MDYAEHYHRLIERAENRVLDGYNAEGAGERGDGMTELRHLQGTTGQVRTALDYQGRPTLVVPVVALVGDLVIHAVNSSVAELVPITTLSRAPNEWDGKPVVWGHPVKDGRQISANSPEVLERHGLGTVSKPRIEKNKLCLDAMIDEGRAEQIGGAKFLESLRAGTPCEVSVGCFVQTELRAGEHGGRKFSAVWSMLQPDHIAMLANSKGACSISDGCGAHRAAEAYEVTDGGLEALAGGNPYHDPTSGEFTSGTGSGVTGFSKDAPAQFDGNSADGKFRGSGRVKIVNPHSNADKVTHTKVSGKRTRQYEGASVHIPTATVEMDRSKRGLPPLQFEAFHHELRTLGGPGGGTEEFRTCVVRREGDQWILYSQDGSKKLGTHDSEESAKRQEHAINISKARKAGHRIPRSASMKKNLKDRMKALVSAFRAARPGDTPEQQASEEAAELISYEAMRSELERASEAIGEASGLIDDLIADETDDPTQTPAQEEAETEVERARLEALCSLIAAATSGLLSVQSMAARALTPDLPEPSDPRYMEALRAALGARNSASDLKMIQTVHDHSVALGAACDRYAAAVECPTCGGLGQMKEDDHQSDCPACGGSGVLKAAESDGDSAVEEDTMKADKIKALIECPCTGFTAADVKALEGFDEARLDAFVAEGEGRKKLNDDLKAAADAKTAAETKAAEAEAKLKAAAEHVPTEDEYLKSAPVSIRTLVEERKAQDAATKTALVAQLKSASVLTEEQLNAKPLDELRTLAAFAKVETPDFSGRGVPMPRNAGEDFVPPDPYEKGLKALRGVN